MINELLKLTAAEQADLVRKKKISAEELLDSVLNRVGETEHLTHAFVAICESEARKKARAVDKKLSMGEPVGSLAGVPYSAKDLFCTKGIKTTAGSAVLRGWKPPYDAAVIERMEQADAVLFGKTNCDEFAMGISNETSAVQPCPCNPYAPDHAAGGSSGGSAAAVAACEGTVSIGTDTGGSIREPAAFCGVVGLKPTYGRVSRWGMIAFASSMDTIGPITRTVKDAALMMNVLAGFDPRDNVTVHVPVPDYSKTLENGVRGMRIGLSPDLWNVTIMNGSGEFENYPCDPEIIAAVEKTAAILEDAGAEIITNVPLPNAGYAIPAYYVISRIEAYSNLQRYDGLKFGRPSDKTVADMYDLFAKSREEGFGHEVKLRILTGLFMSRKEFYEKYYLRAQRARAMIRSDYDRIFDPAGDFRLDVLLTPSTPMPAFRFDRKDCDKMPVQYADYFTSPLNFAGLPGISFPAGYTMNGLPIGFQAAAYDYCEEKILRTAYAAEQVLKFRGAVA